MKVIIKDKDLFVKKKALQDCSHKGWDEEFEVISIVKRPEGEFFLAMISNDLDYYKIDNFSVIDNRIPTNWIFIEYDKPFVIEKWYLLDVEDIKINAFIGPEIFIKKDFLFDVLYNRGKAEKFYESYINNKSIQTEN